MARITLQNVSKSFGAEKGPWAVKDFCLEIADGELVVFVGPSGCGKSTTLRMLAGLEEISSGRITIENRDVTRLPPKDRNVAMVFQNYALYPQKTVYDNLAFGLHVRGEARDEIKRRVQSVAESLDLGALLARKPRQLSGGQMQRVALGRALVRNPDCFLLDEPLSNLDAKLRVKMREEIASLHAKLRATMVFVTHDQVEAMTLGDRIVIMRDGLIQQVGAPLTLYDHPVNTFVAAFIGSPEMNLLDGKVAASNGSFIAHCGNIAIDLPKDVFSDSDEDITLGIRPEHIARSQSPSAIELEVHLVEQIGSHTYVVGEISGSKIRAVFDRDDTIRSRDRISVVIPKERIHLFSRKSGVTLRQTRLNA